MLNVSTNQVSAVYRKTFGEMLKDKKYLNKITEAMKEVQSIAKAEGISDSEKLIDEAFENLKMMSADGKTSMFQDIEAGRKTEVDIFAGNIIKLGKKHNIKTKINEELKKQIESTSREQS